MVTCSQQGGKQTSSEQKVWGFVQLSPSLRDVLALGMGGTWGTEGAGPGCPRGSGQELLSWGCCSVAVGVLGVLWCLPITVCCPG